MDLLTRFELLLATDSGKVAAYTYPVRRRGPVYVDQLALPMTAML